MRKIELLSPAKNLVCGVEAIRHGADAIYIGGPAFGARQAAGNSIKDIASLCNYAHIFGVKIYVALNTIIYDDELATVEEIIRNLYEVGVDALIIQDTSILKMNIPPIALHASTQMHNNAPEKIRSLEAAGFSQAVLARELSLDEISAIHHSTHIPLEAFVHGALCTSYSGHCYASQFCFKRSANRGNCAQFCRLAFDLVDAEGKTIIHNKHLLSLRDMNRSSSLEAMMDAGISSFKIEGRLKDIDYVKNVTAYYRQEIDKILSSRSNDYERASIGRTELKGFSPKLERSFNRGFTDFFLHGHRDRQMCSFHTPKAIGETVGTVASVGSRDFTISYATGVAPITAGDGLCFINKAGDLQGFRVNTVTAEDRIIPQLMPAIANGITIYRNYDHAFNKVLQHPTATRFIEIDIRLTETDDGYKLYMCTHNGPDIALNFNHPKEAANNSQTENIKRILSKLGDTPFRASDIEIYTQHEYFIPASTLTTWRRQATDALLKCIQDSYKRDIRRPLHSHDLKIPEKIEYDSNIANQKAKEFYYEHGARNISPAFELRQPAEDCTIMTCRYCIRHFLGACTKEKGSRVLGKEPLALMLPDGRRFPLSFDCKNCQMKVHATRHSR